MKSIIRISAIVFVLAINTSCVAQKIMGTVSDAQKLKASEKKFIGKSLKILLNEIAPEIKMYTADPSDSNSNKPGSITFRFVDYKEYNKYRLKEKYPVQIRVLVKESFDWDVKSRMTEKNFLWTKKDEEKYGNLTVVAISVFGEN